MFLKKWSLLTKEHQESYENAKICYICKEKFQSKYVKNKKYLNAKDHCHYAGKYKGTAHSICNFEYIVLKTLLIAFHKRSNYDWRNNLFV